MKKITSYTFLLLLISSTCLGGGSTPNNNSILNTPFFTEDFAGGIPADWLNIDNAGQGVLWRTTNTGASNNSFPFSNALSATGTTASNGYAIFDSDSAFGIAGDGLLISDTIDCTGKANVHLMFNEYFAQYQSSFGEVYVSNDGIIWSPALHNAEAGLSQDQTTANPNLVDIDISTYADNQATVFVSFRYNGTSEYFWMVDDVALYELASSDAGVTGIVAPVTTCNLLTNSEPITVNIKNFGADSLSNFLVSYVIDGVTTSTDTVTDTIPGGATLSFTFSAAADLSIPGAHTIQAYTSLTGDGDNSNDTALSAINNGPHLVVNSYTQGFEVPTEDTIGWMTFDANNDTTTWGLSTTLPNTGNQCASFIHDLPTNAANDWLFSTCLGLSDTCYQLDFWYSTFLTSYQAILEVKLFTAQDTGAAVQTILAADTVSAFGYVKSSSLFKPAAIGVYYIGFHVSNADSSCSLKIDDINLTTALCIVGVQPVASKNNDVKIYPNPNNGTFHLTNLNSFNGPVQVTMLDMMGKIVYNQNVVGEDRLTMNLAGQPAGIYTVRISSDTQVTTKLITITK